MTPKYRLKRILILASLMALIIPFLLTLALSSPQVEFFPINYQDIKSDLKHLDRNILVLTSFTNLRKEGMVNVDYDFCVRTELDDQTIIVTSMVQKVCEDAITNGWTIKHLERSSDSQWIQFTKHETTYVMQIWRDEMTAAEKKRHSHTGPNGFMVRATLHGFLTP